MVAEIEPGFVPAAGTAGGTNAISAIRRAVADVHQYRFMPSRRSRGHASKTTSGKLQRFLCRDGFLDGTLGAVATWHDDVAALQTQPVVAAEVRALPAAERIAS